MQVSWKFGPACVLLFVLGCVGGRTQNEQGVATASTPQATGGGRNPSISGATTPLTGATCGYNSSGHTVQVADGISVCLPANICTAETCPPPLGTCVDGACAMKPGYKGVQTLPEAWVTQYCLLSSGGCSGVTQVEPALATAQKLAKLRGLPLCEGASADAPCVGIAASSPLMVGNSQNAIDARTGAPVRPWGLGLSEASNVCYQITGPGGTAHVALTDRCGGYCSCSGSGNAECGPCVNAADMRPNCPCVGTAPGVADVCCGADCPKLEPACDWCASNNHPHFDLDTATFEHVCGAVSVRGSCKLVAVAPVACSLGVSWPPP